MTDYDEETNWWKITFITLLIIGLLVGLFFGGMYYKNKMKLKWQTEAYQVGVQEGQAYLMNQQLQNGVVFTFDGNITKQYKILQVEEIKNE